MAFRSIRTLQVLIREWGEVGSPSECMSCDISFWRELSCVMQYRSKNNCHIIPWPWKVMLQWIAGCIFRGSAKNLISKNGQGANECTPHFAVSYETLFVSKSDIFLRQRLKPLFASCSCRDWNGPCQIALCGRTKPRKKPASKSWVFFWQKPI